ncbi:MAG: tetratricopeptide repeat protein [Gammaproteobacteria bacterium]
MDTMRLAGEAEARYAAGDWGAAAQAYQRLVTAEPANTDAWFRLANARARVGDPDGAVSAYRAVLARDAAYAKAGFNLGMVQLRDAVETFRRLEAEANTDAELSAQAGRLRAALEALLAEQTAGANAPGPGMQRPGATP